MSRPASLRTKIIVGNGLVMVALLGIFGATLSATTYSGLLAQIDGDLRREAERASQRPPPPKAPPPDFGLGDPFRRRPGPPPDDLYAGARRAADIRLPRFFGFQDEDERDADPSLDPEGLRIAQSGRSVLREVTWRGGRIRVLSVPFRRDGEAGVVQVARESGDLARLARTQAWTLVVLLPVAGIVAAGVAVFATRRALRPVDAMAAAAARIGGGGDLTRRIEVEGDDELARLGRTFNAMLARLHRSFEEQRRFTADAAHELRTPLARLRLATSAAIDGDAGEKAQALAVAYRSGESMARLVDSLLLLARADAEGLALARQRLDLRVVAAEALDGVIGADRVQANFAPEPVMISGDAELLGRVVQNLLENALRHTPPEGEISLHVGLQKGEAEILVRDTGEGIAPEHLPHVFERFYRAEASRERKRGGTGLGLALCKEIVEAHGGRIMIRSEQGTQVFVGLPAVS